MILPEHEANRLLAGAGIPMVPMKIVESLEEAKKEAVHLGYPVVLKLSSRSHPHKTEIGGVHVGIADASGLQVAFGKLEALRERLDPQARLILEPMAPAGAELFIGFQRHPQFGPVISIGLGGIILELLRDIAFRLLPAGAADFREMLAELKTWPKMKAGFRNLPAIDENRILRLMEQTAAFALSHPEVKELDLNPVIAGAGGPMVVDAAIVYG